MLMIDIKQADEKPLVDQYDASLSSMPLLLAIAPNGAVTKGFSELFEQSELMQAFIPPAATYLIKAMQEGKFVFVCVTNNEDANAIPQAVRDFKADPKVSDAVELLQVNLHDEAERVFLEELELTEITETTAAMLVPPGFLLGQFTEQSTKDEIIKTLQEYQAGCDSRGCAPGNCGPLL
jgi:hypothetical protein